MNAEEAAFAAAFCISPLAKGSISTKLGFALGAAVYGLAVNVHCVTENFFGVTKKVLCSTKNFRG